MTCAVTTSFLGCFVTILLFARYVSTLEISFLAKTICFIFFILMGCLPLFVSYSFEGFLGTRYLSYRYTLYFIYVSCIILFSLTLFRDIFWVIGFKTGFLSSPLLKEKYIPVNVITVLLALVISLFSLYEGTKVPQIKTIILTSEKITEPKTIALLSDIHIHRVINPEKVRKIIQKTNNEKPDVILLAGDIIDDDIIRVSSISQLLKELKAPEGVYYVTGNHEFYVGYKDTVKELNQLGFTLLENNGLPLKGNIFLAGVPDWFSASQHNLNINLQKAFAKSTENQYRILISHTPVDFKEKNNFDLEVSGHTHGGQIFPFHFFVKLANKYIRGLSKMNNNAKIYVSPGAGQWGPQMRFLAPSEISIIKLQPK